jgi:hypothetical protein
MKFLSKLISQLLILSMVLLPFSTQAGMIGTDRVVSSAAAQADRAKVADFVARADVQQQMEVLGLTPANAKDRVAALTDEEVQRIAGKIDSAPAGASSTGTAWVVGAVIIIAVLVYIYWK